MTTTRVLAACAAALLTPAGPAPAQESPTDQVRSVIERFHAALSEGDTATVLALLHPDVVVLESGGAENYEEYRAHHMGADMAFAAAVERTRRPIRVVVRHATAWAASRGTASGTFRGRSIDSRTAELIVLRRDDGRWRISAIHWSSRSGS